METIQKEMPTPPSESRKQCFATPLADRVHGETTIPKLPRQRVAERLAHGEIGQGMNDYDAIFSTLNSAGFDGWISIEDGVDGPEQLERSVAFLRRKMTEHFP